MFQRLPFVLLLAVLVGCVKDRDIVPDTQQPGGIVIAPGVLKLNEFVASGSQNVNEFGTAEDWFEIYNPNNQELVLEEGKWFVTDGGPSTPMKYQLPALTIPARGFLLIWCDGLNTVATQVHTNFALSSAGEHLLIHYKSDEEEFTVDDYQFGPQDTGGASMGRYPDGGEQWILFTAPTPGASNQ
jgi:hypothetical protein